MNKKNRGQEIVNAFISVIIVAASVAFFAFIAILFL